MVLTSRNVVCLIYVYMNKVLNMYSLEATVTSVEYIFVGQCFRHLAIQHQGIISNHADPRFNATNFLQEHPVINGIILTLIDN